MNRTDIHRPSAIVPSEYDFVAFECIKIEGLGDCEAIMRERARIEAHMARTGGTYSDHAHGGNCMICGNVFATYTVLFYHRPTNVYVRAGQDCAQKLQMSSDGAFSLFTAAVRDAREAQAGKRKAQALLADMKLTGAWDLYVAEYSESFKYEENTVRDIVGKLVKYGSISEKQQSFLGGLLDRIANRAQVEAQRAAETANAKPWVAGRQEVTGKMVYFKWQEGYMRGQETLKTLIVTESGSKLWVTLPSAVQGTVEELKGKTVTMMVNVQPKEGEPTFAFGKRPYLHKLH